MRFPPRAAALPRGPTHQRNRAGKIAVQESQMRRAAVCRQARKAVDEHPCVILIASE